MYMCWDIVLCSRIIRQQISIYLQKVKRYFSLEKLIVAGNKYGKRKSVCLLVVLIIFLFCCSLNVLQNYQSHRLFSFFGVVVFSVHVWAVDEV